ncbi:hypothetical protein HPB47_016097 [Ixodes persulcatus]|uniref:Uncharacterized protein n=1 Tax=Ixodes persulcatus TaxID=34615 RepID=A0AC60QTS0_IXOPE|nr:hypothetical protein HPB47_016097 [Ixodes persulcatus]
MCSGKKFERAEGRRTKAAGARTWARCPRRVPRVGGEGWTRNPTTPPGGPPHPLGRRQESRGVTASRARRHLSAAGPLQRSGGTGARDPPKDLPACPPEARQWMVAALAMSRTCPGSGSARFDRKVD